MRAAGALEAVFRADPGVEEVVHRDALDFSNKLFRDFYSKLYDRLVRKAPEFLGWWYKQSDEPWKTDDIRLTLDRLNAAPLVKFIKQFRPDITVCTHFMPAGVIGHLIERQKLDARLAIVVTDLDFHAMWLSRTFHRYFVAIEETRRHLIALGLPGERITTSGIPIDPVFSEPVDAVAVRRSLGLEEGRPTLLLSAGTLGAGPTELVIERLMQLQSDAQTIVICGRNEELLKSIRATVANSRRPFAVLGYTDRMHELMKSADLFIGKPGGLTTAEALACGLPMAIVSPIPGQEERNSDHLLEKGIAIKCNELTTIPFKIDRLLGDPAMLKAMSGRARGWGKPDAAKTVVDTLLHDDLPPVKLTPEQREEMTRAAGKE